MKAILLTAAGGVENLKLTEVATPELSDPNFIRVRLKAAGINPIDYKMRQKGGMKPDKLPTILGCDGAGIVDAIGKQVTRFKIGDEVYFFNGGIGTDEPGNYAEYTTIHQDYVASKPKTLSMIEAAALPLAWITVWESLVDRVQLKPNQTILIQAGAGGVGHLGIQLAKILGAKVAVTISSSAKAQFAESLGADFCINYQETNFVKEILNWTKQKGVDVVFDTVGGNDFCASIPAMNIYGKMVTILDPACDSNAIKIAKVRNLSLIYELMLTPMLDKMCAARIAQRIMLEEANLLIGKNKLRVKVSQTFPLEQVAEAHKMIETGHTTGKIVLTIE